MAAAAAIVAADKHTKVAVAVLVVVAALAAERIPYYQLKNYHMMGKTLLLRSIDFRISNKIP